MSSFLLKAGSGLRIGINEFNKLTTSNIKGILMDKGFILTSGAKFSDESFKDMIKEYGDTVEYVGKKKDVGYGYKDLLKLSGDKGKVVTGRGELPLHADGGLLQTRVDLVFLYAEEIENMKFQGSTNVVDHKLAIPDMPMHLRRVLEEEVFESRVLERGYYVDASPESWFEVPTFTDLGWVRKFLIYFPFTGNNPPSWETRIRGFSDKETAQFFHELKIFFEQPKYFYKHFWKKDDLLIMDNRRVIHSRDPFDGDVKRVLYRGQTVHEKL